MEEPAPSPLPRRAPVLAAAVAGVIVVAMAALVFAPAEARLSVLPPAWTLDRVQGVELPDGTRVIVVAARDAAVGAVAARDRLTRFTVFDGKTGRQLGARTFSGEAWIEAAAPPAAEPADRARGGAPPSVRGATAPRPADNRVWVRRADETPPLAVSLPDLADAPAPGEPPRGPAAAAGTPLCLTSKALMPSGREVRLTDGERSQIDPGVGPGEPAPEPQAPQVDEHGHVAPPATATARGPVYREATIVCASGADGRAPILAEGEDLLVLHKPEDPRERQPLLTRVSETARRRWTLDLRRALPEGLEDGQVVVRWARPIDADTLAVALDWWRGDERRWVLAGLDVAAGEPRYGVVAVPSR